MSIKVVIPASGRYELTRRVILYYEDLGYETMVVWDRGDRPHIEPSIADRAYPDGGTLGEKFNFCLTQAILDPFLDGVLLVGSDNLILPEYIERIAEDKPDYREIHGCHFFNSKTGKMVFTRRYYCGAGKYFSHKFLKACDYSPYDPKAEKDVDGEPKKKLYKHGFKPSQEESLMYKPLCVDIKTDENMTSWERIEQDVRAETVDVPEFVFDQMNGERTEWWRGL